MSSWAVALRVARREARRAPGRSALVLAMIALPVLGVAAVDVVARTYELSPAQQATRDVGAADAAVSDSGLSTVEQSPQGYGYSSQSASREAIDPASVLPPGSRTLVDRRATGDVTLGDKVARVDLRELAYADPLATGLYRQAQGRPPAVAGEVALTRALAERLGARLGDRLQLPTGPATVVGTVSDGSSYGAVAVLLAPGQPTPESTTRLLVDLPGPLTWDLVRTANAAGVLVQTRGVPVPGQPEEPTGVSVDSDTLATLGLVVGMALLEVVLLAGPAFAVGAKRQERVLALLQATGAERRDVRRTVLAGGVVLGVVAGVLGVAGGVLLAGGALPVLEGYRDAVPGPFDVRPLEVLAIAAVGAGTALLAALLPAVNAGRQNALAGLTGRRGVRRGNPAVPAVGLVAAVAGALLALQGARSRSINTILAGAALAELGLVATTPALVGLAGRLGPLLPAAPRLALRDAARNRSRTAPAVAAVLAAVAGSVAVSTFVSSLDENDRRSYPASAARGTLLVPLEGDAVRAAAAVTGALARVLPDSRSTPVQALGVGGQDRYAEVLVPPEQRCPDSPAQRRRPLDTRCAPIPVTSQFGGQLMVGGPDVARALMGVTDAAALGVLDRGGVLVAARSLRADGTAVVVVSRPVDGDGTDSVPHTFPAAALPAGALQMPLVSPAAAGALGQSATLVGLAVTGPALSDAQEDRARAAVVSVAPGARVVLERGYESAYGVGLLALLAGSALLVIGASGIATGLAAADGRADLSTLAAVGASPGCAAGWPPRSPS
ncbi:MAG TPA: FtsX-like permease family protein [Mycobacteriales bacterium]|nr:FtsX-like permease family protein [Mycobacteriales bacterium]